MGVRENADETYFKEQVKGIGGRSYKWVSPGVLGVPDQIVFISGFCELVEIKTIVGVLSPWQKREIDRLRETGIRVTVVYGRKEIDAYIAGLKERCLKLKL